MFSQKLSLDKPRWKMLRGGRLVKSVSVLGGLVGTGAGWGREHLMGTSYLTKSLCGNMGPNLGNFEKSLQFGF